MNRIIQVYLVSDTVKRLTAIGDERGDTIESLAEAAISEAALDYFRGRSDDPAKKGKTP